MIAECRDCSARSHRHPAVGRSAAAQGSGAAGLPQPQRSPGGEGEHSQRRSQSSIATINGLLPTAVLLAGKSNAGTAGRSPHRERPDGGRLFRRWHRNRARARFSGTTFRPRTVGAYGQIQVHDRVAQADYAIDQLQIRQQQLTMARDFNQAQVAIANSVVALKQARARYEAAGQSLTLQQKLYEAEQKRLAVGESTTYNVTQQQRDFIERASGATVRDGELAERAVESRSDHRRHSGGESHFARGCPHRKTGPPVCASGRSSGTSQINLFRRLRSEGRTVYLFFTGPGAILRKSAFLWFGAKFADTVGVYSVSMGSRATRKSLPNTPQIFNPF